MQRSVASFCKCRGRVAAALALAAGMLGLFWALMVAPTQGAAPALPDRHPRLESALRDLVAAYRTGDALALADLVAQYGVSLSDGLVRVVVVGEGEGDGAAVARQIAALSGRVGAANGPWTQADLPVEALLALADAPGVHLVRRPWRPLAVVSSQGVTVTQTIDWQWAGLNGQGIRVGVLDLGFLGYSSRISEGELPSDVITRSFIGGGSIRDFWGYPTDSHGTACAEIVHDMAPRARLYLANFGDEVEWADAVDWLLAQGVDVVSFSAGWPVGGPGDGSGYLAAKVSDVRNAGVLWVNAAGNSAQRHWMGLWNDPDTDDWLNYAGSDETNEITVTVGGDFRVVVGLRWNDPWGGSANDYDLFLFDSALKQLVSSENVQDGSSDPWEFIDYAVSKAGVYRLAVSRQAGALPCTLELFSYSHDFHYRTLSSSLLIPADSLGSLAVGATWWQNDALESFSSQGPTLDGRIKPDLAAPDGVRVRTEPYASGFYGTSASAPHVAGAAALVMQAYPAFTTAQVQNWLEDHAIDLGPAGKDNAYGAGRLDLSPEISEVTPGAALQGETVTLVVSGVPFTSTTRFYLSRPGYANLLPGSMTRLSFTRLTGTLNLSGVAAGPWTMVITPALSGPITHSNAFLVASNEVHLPLVLKSAHP